MEALRSDRRRWGLGRALFSRLMRGLDRYAGFHLYRVFLRPLGIVRPAVDDPSISLRMVRPDELYQATNDPELELAAEFVQEALARGDSAFGAFEGEKLVAYMWRTSTAAPHIDDLWVTVRPPYGYGFKSFCRESHRGRGLAKAISFYSDVYGLERGYTGIVGFVEVSNYPSLAVERSKRCQASGYAGYVSWFGRSYTFRSAAARKIGFALLEKKKPRPSSAADRSGTTYEG